MQLPTVQDFAQSIWTEIQTLKQEGVIPANVRDFSELHDYVDANVLGDFEKYGEACIDKPEWDAFSDMVDEAQSIVDEWLANGQPAIR